MLESASANTRYQSGVWLGTLAGTAATSLIVNRVPFVTLSDEIAFAFHKLLLVGILFAGFVKLYGMMFAKSLGLDSINSIANDVTYVVLKISLFSTIGGMFAHIGHGQLYVIGTGASFISSAIFIS